MKDPLVLFGDYLLTEVGTSPIPRGAVVMEGGKVVCCGPSQDILNRYPAAQRFGGPGKIVIPGLIDSHQHGRGVTNIQRGVQDGPLEEWLVRLRGLWPVTPYVATALAAIRLIRSGVTTAMHHFASSGVIPLQDEMVACLQAYRDVGLRVTFTFDFRDVNSYVYEDDRSFLATLAPDLAKLVNSALPGRLIPKPSTSSGWIKSIREQYASPTIQFALGPQGADWSSDELLSDIAEFSQAEEMPVHAHMLESQRQRLASLKSHGKSPVQRFADIGLLTPETSLAHVVWADADDLDMLERCGASVAHNPASNLRLNSGIAPVRSMIERGIRIGIGMDGMSLSDQSDFFQDLRLCAALHFEAGSSGLSNAAVWDMVYAGGANATFWDGQIGNLRPGSRGDAAVIELPASPLTRPLDPGVDLLDRVLRECSPAHVQVVTVDGRIVLDNGRITTVREDAIMSQLNDEAAEVDEAILRSRREIVKRLENAVSGYYSNDTWNRAQHRLNLF